MCDKRLLLVLVLSVLPMLGGIGFLPACGGTEAKAPTAAPTIHAPDEKVPKRPQLAAIDVYGSKHISEEAILSRHEAAIREAWAMAPAERKAAEEAIRLAILAKDEIEAQHDHVLRYGGAGELPDHRYRRSVGRIIASEQPNNHDFAYLILKAISGENHGERDYRAWTEWRDSLEPSKQ